MTEPEKTPEETQHATQLIMVRQSLLASLFQQYNTLTQMIRTLPIPAEIPGIFKGLSYLEDGMLWIKEVLIACPIEFAASEKKDVETPVVESEEKPQESHAESTAA